MSDHSNLLSGSAAGASAYTHIYIDTHTPTTGALHKPLRTLAAYKENNHCVNFTTQQDKRKIENNEFQQKFQIALFVFVQQHLYKDSWKTHWSQQIVMWYGLIKSTLLYVGSSARAEPGSVWAAVKVEKKEKKAQLLLYLNIKYLVCTMSISRAWVGNTRSLLKSYFDMHANGDGKNTRWTITSAVVCWKAEIHSFPVEPDRCGIFETHTNTDFRVVKFHWLPILGTI